MLSAEYLLTQLFYANIQIRDRFYNESVLYNFLNNIHNTSGIDMHIAVILANVPV